MCGVYLKRSEKLKSNSKHRNTHKRKIGKHKMKKILNLIALLGLVGLGQTNAATIFAGDVAVYRVGANGSAAALTSGNNAVFVDVFRNTGGTWSLNQTIAMPTVVSGNNQILTASGTAGSEGFINMSEDGRYFVLGGYNNVVNNVAASTALGTGKSSTDRTIGLLTLSSGSVDTTTHGAWGLGSAGQNIRSVASHDGTSFYATTDGGIYYGAYGASAAAPSLIKVGNLRGLEISQGNLLVGTGSANAIATGSTAGAIGTTSGLPTSTATMTRMFNEAAGTSPYGFSLLDLNKDGVDETAYIADSSGGINKMYFDGSTWTSKGVIAGTYSGLEAVYNGTSVDIFVTAASGLTLGTLNDASAIGGALTGTVTTIGTAGANTAFRGVAVAAVPEPSAQALLGLGMVALVAVRALRRGRSDS